MANMDFSIITGVFFQWVQTGLFWLVMAIILTIGSVTILVVKKRRRLKYDVLEIIGFGNGKIGVNHTKAGIFKKYTTLFGLWDYGNENYFKVKDGRRILQGSTDDLQDIFGKKGFIVKRKDDDPKILVPLSRFEVKNEKLLAEIAPADFRDASVEIFEEAKKETQGWVEKYLPYIMIAGVILFFIISMILATQFFNRTVDKAGEILLQAGQNAGNIKPSTTAP